MFPSLYEFLQLRGDSYWLFTVQTSSLQQTLLALLRYRMCIGMFLDDAKCLVLVDILGDHVLLGGWGTHHSGLQALPSSRSVYS